MPTTCPNCRAPMTPYEHAGVTLDLRQKCRGLWFDTGELRKVQSVALDLVPVPVGPAVGAFYRRVAR
jgi:Zn-finger nucleic acid-binding protein